MTMFQRCSFPSSFALALAALAAAACSSSTASPAAAGVATTDNLIANGNADAANGSQDGSPVPTPGWTSTGEATALEYGVSSYPAATDPGPTDRGTNLFVGGQDDMSSSLTQTIDLTAYGAAIAGGGVTYTLTGWLGGYNSQEDSATLTITFEDGSGSALATGSIGPVTAEDRMGSTGLLERSGTGAVPKGTQSVLVELDMTRTDGSANDGYADDLSLVLTGI
jgi:hypothetical protein